MGAQLQAVPLAEHEDVKKVIALYVQNGMEQEKSDVEVLLKHIEFMETQFGKVFDELKNVRSQLETLQDKGIRATVTRIVDAVEIKVTEAKAQFVGLKDSILRSFSGALEAVKEKGVSALKSTADFLKTQTRSALSSLKGKLEQAVASLHRGVTRIESVKTELHAAKSHVSNAGRLMLGKETKDTPAYDSERGVLAGIQKFLGKTGSLLSGIGKVTDSAMRKIEGMGQPDEKRSVKQNLREFKNAHTGGKSPERDSAR